MVRAPMRLAPASLGTVSQMCTHSSSAAARSTSLEAMGSWLELVRRSWSMAPHSRSAATPSQSPTAATCPTPLRRRQAIKASASSRGERRLEEKLRACGGENEERTSG
eukprot:scaffold188113_cov34-Tisochrysis_lutea.AAC.2